MNLKSVHTFFAASAIVAFAPSAVHAHVGVVNTQRPYAVAGSSYELFLTVPHGCAFTEGGVAKDADTYKVEVTTPAGFNTPRPIIDGVFGKPVRTTTGDTTTLTWTKDASLDSAEDDQAYRVGIRGAIAAGTEFTTMRFNTKQYCKNPQGGQDLVIDWSNYVGSTGATTNESPTVRVLPARAPGWNKYNVSQANEKHTPADVKDFVTGFFSDSQIVWVRKGVYSPNAATQAKLDALVAKDATYYRLDTSTSAENMIHADYDLWVKY